MSSILLSIPLTTMFFMFDYMVHLQFDHLQEFNLEYLKSKSYFLPSILILGFATEKFKNLKVAQYLFLVAAVYFGCRVIYNVSEDETFGAYKKTPGLITAGLLLIIQLDLYLAVSATLCCAGYYFRNSILPKGEMKLGGEL